MAIGREFVIHELLLKQNAEIFVCKCIPLNTKAYEIKTPLSFKKRELGTVFTVYSTVISYVFINKNNRRKQFECCQKCKRMHTSKIRNYIKI